MGNEYLIKINESVNELFYTIEQRMSDDDMIRIRSAYELAKEAHKNQKRKTGEPYIIHPIAVARIVAEEFELGANPIMAAFLHDVIEDTHYTLDDIKERFGDDVAFLVGVVTKQKKAEYNQSKQIDNYRQILASVQFDVRAILIKLADRLHNMRTLDSMKPDKQMKIAGETDYFYAPLANRLGMYHVKTELENLSFRFRCPREYYFLENLMEKEKTENQSRIDAFISKMEYILKENNIRARTEIRYRMPYSMWRKMNSMECDFQHVYGKHYVRIVYEASGIMEEKYISLKIYSVLTDYFKEKPGSVSNYINAPKENGYQSFHLKLLCDNGNWEEIHISSERMVRNSRLGCAAERTESNLKSWLDKFKENAPDVSFVNTSGRQAANADPHVWTSYRRLIKMAGVICEALCDADPEHQEYFKANLKKTVSSLEAADQEVQRELQSVRQRAFLIYHPTLTYFAEDYGLMQIAIENEGKEPSPQRLAELIEQCRKENVGVIFIQEEFDRKNAELIARETRTQLVSINPLAYDYDKELRQIAKILSKQ